MSSWMRKVRDYLDELAKTKNDRSEQVKEGLEIYIDLWKKAIENKVVEESDDVDVALSKIEGRGGLRRAAEG